MKQRKPAPAQYAPKVEPKEITLDFTPCIVCHKQILEGPYGRWEAGNVCSKTCNTTQSEKPKDFGEPPCGTSASTRR